MWFFSYDFLEKKKNYRAGTQKVIAGNWVWEEGLTIKGQCKIIWGIMEMF